MWIEVFSGRANGLSRLEPPTARTANRLPALDVQPLHQPRIDPHRREFGGDGLKRGRDLEDGQRRIVVSGRC